MPDMLKACFRQFNHSPTLTIIERNSLIVSQKPLQQAARRFLCVWRTALACNLRCNLPITSEVIGRTWRHERGKEGCQGLKYKFFNSLLTPSDSAIYLKQHDFYPWLRASLPTFLPDQGARASKSGLTPRHPSFPLFTRWAYILIWFFDKSK